MSEEEIRGIWWRYPILNGLIRFFKRLRDMRMARLSKSGLKTTVKNMEKISWIDYKGNKRNVIIEREVKET